MSADQKKIKSRERAIGKKAAKMAQDYVHSVLRQKLSIRGEGYEKMKPILDATKVRAKMGSHRLLGLDFTSSKIGFILHYGFTGVRQGGEVFLKAARYHKSSTDRDAHKVDLPSRLLFDDMYQKSGAIDYLIENLAETRLEAETIKIQNLLLKLNRPENG
jgi:hypothetical protein